MNGIKRRFAERRGSLLFKLMFACTAIFVIPVFLLYAYLNTASSAQAISDAGYRNSTALKNVSDTMDEVFRHVNAMQSQLQADSAISNASFSNVLTLEDQGYAAWEIIQTVSRTLYQYYLNTPYVYSVELYNPYASILFYSRISATRQVVHHPPAEALTWVEQAENASPGRWYLDRDEEGRLWFVSYTRPFFVNKPFDYQYSRVVISAQTLEEKARTVLLQDDFTLAVRSERGAASEPVIGKGIGLAEDVEDGEWTVTSVDGRRYLSVARRSAYMDWVYELSVPIDTFDASSTIFSRSFGITFICLVIIFLSMCFFLLREVIHPINAISRGIRVAEAGDLSVRLDIRSNDELGRIGKQFNVMLASIEQLIHENYETRLIKNEIELKFIQTQLKEHFLYNTLDSVHWIAHSYHVPQISEIIFHLSHFFRLTLNGGSDRITVTGAAEILRSYITLVNVRMGDTIALDMHVDASIADRQTYKYFFQPIVENAYQHGLRPRLGGRLEIRFCEEPEGCLRYTVKDDGVGMTAEKLRALLEDIHGERTGEERRNFALCNIDRQLQLYFGKQYTFTIQSSPQEGTEVTLIFPLISDERPAPKGDAPI